MITITKATIKGCYDENIQNLSCHFCALCRTEC